MKRILFLGLIVIIILSLVGCNSTAKEVEKLKKEAQIYIDVEKYNEAIDIYKEIIKIQNNEANQNEFYELMILNEIRGADFKEAISLLEQRKDMDFSIIKDVDNLELYLNTAYKWYDTLLTDSDIKIKYNDVMRDLKHLKSIGYKEPKSEKFEIDTIISSIEDYFKNNN